MIYLSSRFALKSVATEMTKKVFRACSKDKIAVFNISPKKVDLPKETTKFK